MEDAILCLVIFVGLFVIRRMAGPHPPDVDHNPEPGSWWSECFRPDKWSSFSKSEKLEVLAQYDSWCRLRTLLAKSPPPSPAKSRRVVTVDVAVQTDAVVISSPRPVRPARYSFKDMQRKTRGQ
ncbi:hypothetical protein WJX74_008838 [Apatococcus lobatus]|uniref:Uncharacterized protein n=1 Tax=Apatococcus lobatus TaxID=904363 RepID=A0AAW1Q774_9CHLO